MVYRCFLLSVFQGKAIRGTERVSGRTRLCLVRAKPQSQREKGPRTHL